MNYLNVVRISWKAIVLNKLRTLLTMLGIIIGVAAVITMLAIGEGSKESIKTSISAMGSNMLTIRPGAEMRGGVRMSAADSQSLTLSDLEKLKTEVTYAENFSPLVNSSAQLVFGSNNWPSSIYGVDLSYLDVRVWDTEDGTMFTEDDVKKYSKVAVIGKTVQENLFTNNEDPLGKTIRVGNIPFKVIGVLSKKGENTFGQDQDDVILAPYTAVMKRILATTYLQSVVASAKSEDLAEPAVEQIEETLRSAHNIKSGDDDFNVFSQQELISTFSSTSEMLTILLVAVAAISLLIGGIGIMNIMYVSVKERTREIGLRMAVGAKGKDILIQFLIESIMISFTGGLLGIFLGLLATYLVSVFAGWPVTVTSLSIIISFAVCTLTGIFFGWYPARKASSLDPITALRYE